MKWYILAGICGFIGYKSYKVGEVAASQICEAYDIQSSKAMEAMLKDAKAMKVSAPKP